MRACEILDLAWKHLGPGTLVRVTLWALYEGKIDGGIQLRSPVSIRGVWAPHRVTESVSRNPSAEASKVVLKAEIAALDRSGDRFTLGLLSRVKDQPVIWIPDEILIAIEPQEN